jgi:hypothetical protein
VDFIGYFGRAAGFAGANYWETQLVGGGSTQAAQVGIAAGFASGAEAQALYPFLAAPLVATQAQIVSFVNAVFMNLFGHPQAAGATYWPTQLTATIATAATQGSPTAVANYIANAVGQFIYDVALGAAPADQIALSAKVQVANFFTADSQTFNIATPVGSLAWTEATNVISGVTSPTQVAAAEAAIGTFFANAATGQTFTLTVAPDIMPGLVGSNGTSVTGNDTIIGTNLTLSPFDNLNGGAGNNLMIITDTTGAGPGTGAGINTSTIAGLAITNVQNATFSSQFGNIVVVTTPTVLNNVVTINETVGPGSIGTITTSGNATSVSVTGTASEAVVTDASATPTLAAVTLSGIGIASTVTDNALATLTLNTSNAPVLVTQTTGGHTLGLVVNGDSVGATVTDNFATTVNVTSTVATSTLSVVTTATDTSFNVLSGAATPPAVSIANAALNIGVLNMSSSATTVTVSDADTSAVVIGTLNATATKTFTVTDTGGNLTLGTVVVGGVSSVNDAAVAAGVTETYTNTGTGVITVGTNGAAVESTAAFAGIFALNLNGAVAYQDLFDGVATGINVIGGTDNSRVVFDAFAGAGAAATSDNITLGNGSNVVADFSVAGQVNVTLGSGANTVLLGDGNEGVSPVPIALPGLGAGTTTTGVYNVVLAPHTVNNTISVPDIGAGVGAGTFATTVIQGAMGSPAGQEKIMIDHAAAALTQVVIGPLSLWTPANIAAAGSPAIAIGEIGADLVAAAVATPSYASAIFGGNTYVVEEQAHVFAAASTVVVELTGVHTIGNSATLGAFTVLS